MTKRLLAVMGASMMLAGCGAYDEMRLAQIINDFRMTCSGAESNECADELVDINLMIIDRFRDQAEKDKKVFSHLYGVDAYAEALKIIDRMEEMQEDQRPGFFSRLFLSEAPPFGRNTNMIIPMVVYQEIGDAAVAKRKAAKSGKAKAELNLKDVLNSALSDELPSDPATPAPAPAPAPTAAVAPALSDAPELFTRGPDATQELTGDHHQLALDVGMEDVIEASDGGTEYVDAREILLGDFNADDIQDVVVLYTIEGSGGGNGYYRELAMFYGNGESYDLQGSTSLEHAASSDLRITSYGLFAVKALEHAPEDSNCCPSIETKSLYRFDGTQFNAI